jgi:hypothetical protein
MRIEGKRLKRTRFVHTDRYVVAVDVEMVVPDDDPSEPCYEAETIAYLKQIEERAKAGEVDWLKTQGRVYKSLDVR